MRQVGRCDCGKMGFKLKYNSWVCRRCDKIENTVLHEMHKLTNAQREDRIKKWYARYIAPPSYFE